MQGSLKLAEYLSIIRVNQQQLCVIDFPFIGTEVLGKHLPEVHAAP